MAEDTGLHRYFRIGCAGTEQLVEFLSVVKTSCPIRDKDISREIQEIQIGTAGRLRPGSRFDSSN